MSTVNSAQSEMDLIVRYDKFLEMYRDSLTEDELSVVQDLNSANRMVSDEIRAPGSVDKVDLAYAEEVLVKWSSPEFKHIRKKFDAIHVQFGRVVST